jgi:hypothetical protein
MSTTGNSTGTEKNDPQNFSGFNMEGRIIYLLIYGSFNEAVCKSDHL